MEIEDSELDTRLEEMGQEKIMIYGELERDLDEDEESLFRVDPKMSTYERITRKGLRADIEEAFAKLRYSRIYEKSEKEEEVVEGVELTEEEKERFQYMEAMEDQVYCPQRKKLNMSKKRVTDIKTNRRVMLTDPRPAKEEAVQMVRKDRLLAETEKYIREKCNEMGEVKDR